MKNNPNAELHSTTCDCGRSIWVPRGSHDHFMCPGCYSRWQKQQDERYTRTGRRDDRDVPHPAPLKQY